MNVRFHVKEPGISETIVKLLNIFQLVDKNIIIARYEHDLERQNEKVIDKSAEIPKILTISKQCVFQIKYQQKGRTMWTNIKIVRIIIICDILNDIKYYLKISFGF